jgi:hypothetical protein
MSLNGGSTLVNVHGVIMVCAHGIVDTMCCQITRCNVALKAWRCVNCLS